MPSQIEMLRQDIQGIAFIKDIEDPGWRERRVFLILEDFERRLQYLESGHILEGDAP